MCVSSRTTIKHVQYIFQIKAILVFPFVTQTHMHDLYATTNSLDLFLLYDNPFTIAGNLFQHRINRTKYCVWISYIRVFPFISWIQIPVHIANWEYMLPYVDFFMSVASLYTPCFVMLCVFLYGPFCHGAHKIDVSTLFTTFFLWKSLPFILL